MLRTYMIGIYVSIVEKKTCFKILASIKKKSLRLALISIITKQKPSFGIYNKNKNSNNDISRHVYKMNHPL